MGIDLKTRLGKYIETTAGGEHVRAYVPPPLPPDPPIQIEALLGRLSAADRALGSLDGITTLLPDKALFLYMYDRCCRHVVRPFLQPVGSPNLRRNYSRSGNPLRGRNP